MVPNSRTAPHAGAIKPLNAPASVQVRTDDTGRPVAVRLPVLAATRPGRSLAARPGGRQQPGGRPGVPQKPRPAGQVRHTRSDDRRNDPTGGSHTSDGFAPWQAVASVDDSWKVVDEWWRGPDQQIARMYYSIVLESGQRTTLFSDSARNAWFRQAS